MAFYRDKGRNYAILEKHMKDWAIHVLNIKFEIVGGSILSDEVER